MQEEPIEYIRCDYKHAEQYRYRHCTGSIGLESNWSEWNDGRMPFGRGFQGTEFEYRCTKEHLFLEEL